LCKAVLHAFQKKSRKDVKTGLADVRLISQRLKAAKEDCDNRYANKKT
jgi:phage-related protein